MQIDIAGASSNGASAIEPTGAPSETGNTSGSFADLLNGVAEDQDDSTPVDEVDEEEPIGDEWVTMPVVVPFLPVIPQDVVDTEDGNATSVEAIGEDIAAEDVDAPLPASVPEIVTAPDVKSFVAGEAPKPEAKQMESPAVRETSVPRAPAVDADPVEIVSDILTEAVESDAKIEATTAIASQEAPAAEPGAKLDKAARTVSAPKTVDANETAKTAVAEVAANSPVQSAVDEMAASQAESVSNNGSSEPAPGPKGVAARFARAIERAIEHAVAPAARTGENNQSPNQNADGRPSFGEWLREQLPQLAAANAHNGVAPVFALAAPAQNDARVSGLLAASGVNLPASTSALPNERDMTLQIVQSMRMQFRDGIGEAVLRLKPEHLGSVSISLRVENGGLKANVQADIPAVRQWLESQQDTLRSALAEHGLRLDRFDVEPDAQRQQAGDNPRDEQSTRRRQRRRIAQDDEPVFEVVV